jgi:hypothetical protein
VKLIKRQLVFALNNFQIFLSDHPHDRSSSAAQRAITSFWIYQTIGQMKFKNNSLAMA